jgi:hypothetical protein
MEQAMERLEEADWAEAHGPLPDGFLEIYTLSVEMADRVSARRAVASSFFLTVQTGIVASLAFVEGQRWSIALGGIVASVTWWLLLRSYRQLNRAKFDVIRDMEKRLPAAPFTAEWALLDREDAPLRERYAALGLIEQIVPLVFLFISLVALLWDVT